MELFKVENSNLWIEKKYDMFYVIWKCDSFYMNHLNMVLDTATQLLPMLSNHLKKLPLIFIIDTELKKQLLLLVSWTTTKLAYSIGFSLLLYWCVLTSTAISRNLILLLSYRYCFSRMSFRIGWISFFANLLDETAFFLPANNPLWGVDKVFELVFTLISFNNLCLEDSVCSFSSTSAHCK